MHCYDGMIKHKNTYPHIMDSDEESITWMVGTVTPDSSSSTSDCELGTFLYMVALSSLSMA